MNIQAMKRQMIVFLFISLSVLAVAQTKENKKPWILKVNATSLIDIFTFPTVQLSVEKRLTDAFSLSAEVGYQIYDFRQADTVFLKPRGFKANIEGRFYISKLFESEWAQRMNGLYIGLQGFYRQNQYTAEISYYTSQDSINFKSDCFGVRRKVAGINCIAGYEAALSDKIVCDIYMGLGGMNRIITNSDRQFNRDSGDVIEGTDLSPLFAGLHLSEASGSMVCFIMGI